MSQETMSWLNSMTLIGNTDARGNAWHYRAAEQGAESNHYTGAIPVVDVQRRLFAGRPCHAGSRSSSRHARDHDPPQQRRGADALGGAGQAVAPSDRDHVMGMFKDSYKLPQ